MYAARFLIFTHNFFFDHFIVAFMKADECSVMKCWKIYIARDRFENDICIYRTVGWLVGFGFILWVIV